MSDQRLTFRMVAVDQLPPPHHPFKCRFAQHFKDVDAPSSEPREGGSEAGAAFLELLASVDKSACPYHQRDWQVVGQHAQKILEDLGPTPGPGEALKAIAESGLPSTDQMWLASLFQDPITVTSAGDRFVNGQHRACGLRFAGLTNVVVAD